LKLVNKYNQYTFSLMTLIFIISGLVSFFLVKQVFKSELDNDLNRKIARIQTYADMYHTIPTANFINDQKIESEKTNYILKSAVISTVEAHYKDKKKSHISRQIVFTAFINKEPYKVTVTEPIEGTSHLKSLIFLISISTIFCLFITTLLINKIILRKLWRPFYQTIHEVNKFNINHANKLSFPQSQIDEFNFMISTLKSTIDSATENFRSLKEFTENASHEIQTPLAIIRSKLDLLVQHEGLSEEESVSLRSAYGAIKKLSRLNKNLLLLTKIDNNQYNRKVSIDIKNKIEEKVNQFHELWQSDQIVITTNLTDSNIIANPELMEILVSNVLSNATKHNVPQGLIDVQLFENQLRISNSGTPKSLDRERLFKRFYKETNHGDNNGLGLSIVWQICEASGIKASYEFNYNKHAFVFTW
jgi:signal transduction histidine kinase